MSNPASWQIAAQTLREASGPVVRCLRFPERMASRASIPRMRSPGSTPSFGSLFQFEGQRHEGGRRDRLALAAAPLANEIGDPGVAALIAVRLDLRMQRPRGAPLVPRPMRVRLERLYQRLMERA